jgi:predicted acyl esterase
MTTWLRAFMTSGRWRVEVTCWCIPRRRWDRDTEVTGPVSAELYVSSSAVDTGFTAKLLDVYPNGFARNLADGILRLPLPELA